MLKITKTNASTVYVPELDGGLECADLAVMSADMWVPLRMFANPGAVLRAAVVQTTNARTGEVVTVQLARRAQYHIVLARHLHEDWSPHVKAWQTIDTSPVWDRVDFQDKIVLRNDEQRAAYAALLATNNGVLNLACGKGKTVLALKLIAHRGVPAVVIVNNEGLVNQWIDRAKEFLGLEDPDIGIVQGVKAQWDRPLVICMIHTLANRAESIPMETRQRFGTILFDECFPAGTLIGGVPIERLVPGDYVESYDEKSGRPIKKRVLATMRSTPSTLVRIHFADGVRVVCTAGHPFLTTAGWRAAADLTCGDMVRKLANHEKHTVCAVSPRDPQDKNRKQPDRVLRGMSSGETASKRTWMSKMFSETASRTNLLYASARMKVKNPMHQAVCREKVSRRHKELGHKPLVRGGNGKPLPVPQATLLEALGPGWEPELTVLTGNGARTPGRVRGLPAKYAIDVGNLSLRIAVEVDGSSHGLLARQEQDRKKEDYLRGAGWTVLRFSNREVMADTVACAQMVLSTTLK